MSRHASAPRGSWVPVPVCTPACLPETETETGTVPVLRAAGRLLALVAVLAATVVGVAVLGGRSRQRWVRGCAARALRVTGVELRTSGDPFPGAALVVANHLSWIDVLALHASGPVRIQAKREVATWPVIGTVAARAGTLFVDRGGLRALPRTVAETADALRAGSVVAVFPEGTTWCGAAAGPFRRAAFQAALDAGVPVVPVAFVLRGTAGRSGADGAFVGDQTLGDSLLRVLRRPGLVCEMTVLPALPAAGDRRALATAAALAVGAVTGVEHPATGVRRAVPESVPESVAA